MFHRIVVVLAFCVAVALSFSSKSVMRSSSILRMAGPTSLPSKGGSLFKIPSLSSSAPAKKPVVASKAAAPKAAAPTKSNPFSMGQKSAPKKDMTWGGRPDPTPELIIEDKEDFFAAGWRYGRK